MPSLAHNTLVSWLLLAVLMLVAVAPPGGLEVCIGDDGHVHFGADGDIDGCICLGDGCACPTEDHGHKDLGLEAVELVQRESNDSLLALLPAAMPAPLALAPQLDSDAHPAFAGFVVSTLARPPQWPAASRSLVLRS